MFQKKSPFAEHHMMNLQGEKEERRKKERKKEKKKNKTKQNKRIKKSL